MANVSYVIPVLFQDSKKTSHRSFWRRNVKKKLVLTLFVYILSLVMYSTIAIIVNEQLFTSLSGN